MKNHMGQPIGVCILPAMGASIAEKLAYADCLLKSAIYHLQKLSTAYDRAGNYNAAYDVRKTHAKLVAMRQILHSPIENSNDRNH